ncbi:YebY family protein [Gloeobacter violaceus]|uniref:Gll0240 protein n=1 Tax=Gloeobacter violaceus (strain ATCC 29082 / PCC 7421) TaxID=251221 RepID=Q7NP18_GLOVI|nr:YebY family protein [Gloeobacter violaceus]BAC88181.1 gll0240 [Gloeobacter violaceus PCC 7421]
MSAANHRILCTALAAALSLAACGAPKYQPNNRTLPVSKAEYGERWPLAVQSGALDCPLPGAVVLKADGKTYALNGTAESTAKYQLVDGILTANPSGGKVDSQTKIALLQPLVDAGLQLCTD